MRKIFGALVAVAAMGIGSASLLTPALAAPAHPARCPGHWGTATVQSGPAGTVSTQLLSARAGQHGCFDRLVIDLGKGPKPGYTVQYVKHILSQGSGQVLKIRGRARLSVVLRGPAASSFHANAKNLVSVAGFATFRQVRGAGSFERITALGLGVRAKLPFKVLLFGTRHSGWRFIVDVQH